MLTWYSGPAPTRRKNETWKRCEASEEASDLPTIIAAGPRAQPGRKGRWEMTPADREETSLWRIWSVFFCRRKLTHQCCFCMPCESWDISEEKKNMFLSSNKQKAISFILIWLQKYARSDWLLSGQDFLAQDFLENFSRLDGSLEFWVKATSTRAKTTKIPTKYNYLFNNWKKNTSIQILL